MSKQINTVIVLRNDSTTAWESSSYKLRSGEVGVGYFDRKISDTETKKVPIIKVGDDIHTWAELPQAEGVFTSNQILTYNFGRHKTVNGKVDAGGAGMTTSEWLLDALSEVLNPKTNYPTANLQANGIQTSPANSVEIGTKITAVKWKTTKTNGTYTDAAGTGTYGSTGGTTNASGLNDNSFSWKVSNENDNAESTASSGTFSFTSDKYLTINSTEEKTYTYLNGTCTLDPSKAYTPKNNLGIEYETGKIKGFDASGTTEKTFTDIAVKATGYREGFFCGTTTSKTAKTDLTSAVIRGLSKSGANYAAGNKSVTIPVGAATIIFACPAGETGVTKVYNNTVNADMTTSFTKTTNVSVGGGDATSTNIGEYAANYNVWTFTPNEAYGTETSLTVTLG